MNMAYNKDANQLCNHKEESPQRILNDTIDRKYIQEYLSRIIDPMKPSSHPGGHLLNIVSGEMASEKTNTHEAVSLGIDLIHKFRVPIMKPIILMYTKRTSVKIGENKIYDQSFIYARTCGLMMNNPDIKMENCLVTEMAPNPTAYFNEDGTLRTCTSKYLLRVALEERILDRLAQKCNTVVYDVSALLWTIKLPNEGSPLAVYIK